MAKIAPVGVSGYIRDPKLIENTLVTTDTQIIAKTDCKILIPYNYLNYRLASVGETINIALVCAVIVGNRFGVLNTTAGVTISPAATRQIKLDGQEYLEFSFPAGSTVVPNTTFVKDSDLVYEMYKYFYTNGRIPWFMNYDDVGNIFDKHKEYGGLNISPNNVPFEIMTSMICRDPKDKFKYYRHTAMEQRPVVVPFNSVMFNATNTTAKLLGANLEDGITSALMSPSTKPEEIENLLRR